MHGIIIDKSELEIINKQKFIISCYGFKDSIIT